MINKINILEQKLIKEKQNIDEINGELKFVKSQIKEKEELCSKLKKQSEITSKAIELLQFVQKATREVTKDRFETITTHALKSVFQKDISLQLEFGRRGNLPTLDLNVKTENKKEFVDLLDSESGGIINIVSMALRLVLLEISVPKIEGFIVLDEKFVNISEEYLENTIKFLKEINKKLKRQIVFITHNKQITETSDLNIIKLG